ncbi:MAG: ARPP-1 family domain-containing protein [Ktedonobacterales bacterium]
MPNLSLDPNGDTESVAAVVYDFLGQVQLGQTMRQGLLAFTPLFMLNEQGAKHAGCLPLPTALQQGVLTITERPDAQVPELEARSTAPVPVLLLNGEQVVGGLQNRILNATVLVAANTVSHLPVTCVERGRWHPVYETDAGSRLERHSVVGRRSEGAHAAATFACAESGYAELRKMQTKSVSAALASGAGYLADQRMVWGEVSARMTNTGSHSSTHAMQELYRQPARSRELAQMVAALPKPDGALGFIVAIGDKVVGAEIFADEALALAYWEKLARSYAIEALDAEQMGGAQGSVDESALLRFFEQARGSDLHCYQSIGLGQDVRITGKAIAGAGLVYDEAMIQLTLFAEEQPADEVNLAR